MVMPRFDTGLRGPRDLASPLHRSIRRLRLPWHRLVVGVVLSLSFTALLLVAQRWIGRSWASEMVWWMQALELPGRYTLPSPEDTGLFTLPVPTVDLRLRYDGLDGIVAHGLACAVVWILAGWLPDSGKPAAYLLRFGVLVHGASLIYFTFWPARFPHGLTTHVAGGLRQTWALMLVTPTLHLFTYYLFPFAVWNRVLLTTLTLVFLFVLAPLQYASHAALLYLLGLTTMPVLYMLFGVMLPILGLVALYGWAMSWDDTPPGASAAGRNP